jgi:hypothetical protein
MRIDLMWPGTKTYQDDDAQLYPGCAQIEVQSEYTGSLPKGGVKIPEALAKGKPGMQFAFSNGEWYSAANDESRNPIQ